MKKILAVATALVLAISSLCVFVVADTTVTVDGQEYVVACTADINLTLTWEWNQVWSGDTEALSNLATDGAVIMTTYTYVANSSGYGQIYVGLQDKTSYSSGQVTYNTWSSTGALSSTVGEEATIYTALSDINSSGNIDLENVNYVYVSGENFVINSVSVLVPVANDGDETEPPKSSTTTTRFIYVNEDYHALIINGHFICSEHDVDSDGYCTVCKEYIGLDGEVATTTINGGEYITAYSCDVNLVSSGWGTYEFTDNSIIDALATEGAILAITRSKETDIVYGDSTYEKFGLVDSLWVGDWIRLGTGGHTDADEPDDTILDCIFDDGTVVIYDGATVYAAWESAGMNNGGVATLITNTSGTYTVTNVTVYVPAGTVIEEVAVDEPAEDTNSETEDDELDVDDTDAEEVTETNPTTGAVLALVPMAIAGFAVVASKRK